MPAENRSGFWWLAERRQIMCELGTPRGLESRSGAVRYLECRAAPSLEGCRARGDLLQHSSQFRTRRVHGVRKIDDLHADFSKLGFERAPFFGASPVVAFEEQIEANVVPGVDLRRLHFGPCFV